MVVADTFVVVPKLDSLVLSSGDEVLSGRSDGESVDLTGVAAVEHSDGLAVKAVPVGNLSVRSSGKELGLVWVVKHLLEHGGLEQAKASGVGLDVPDDAGSIVGSTDGLGISLVALDGGNSSSVFFKG